VIGRSLGHRSIDGPDCVESFSICISGSMDEGGGGSRVARGPGGAGSVVKSRQAVVKESAASASAARVWRMVPVLR
jgi:hypothetical protein